MKGSHIFWLSIFITCTILGIWFIPSTMMGLATFLLQTLGAMLIVIWMILLMAFRNMDKDDETFLKYSLHPLYWLFYKPVTWINKITNKHLNPNK